MLIEYLNKDLTYEIIGKCFEVHNNLGPGFLEIVYKDALQYEFSESNIPFEREVQYNVTYKDIILPHQFYADFVVFNSIILEVKAISTITDESNIKETLGPWPSVFYWEHMLLTTHCVSD